MSASPCPFQRPECAQAFAALTKTQESHGTAIGTLRERVAGLEARLAVAAGFGALIGGGLATLLARAVFR